MDITLHECIDMAGVDSRLHASHRVVRNYECDPGLGVYVQMEPAMLPRLQRAELLSYTTIFVVVKELQIIMARRHTPRSLCFRVFSSVHGLLAVGTMDRGTLRTPRGNGRRSRSC